MASLPVEYLYGVGLVKKSKGRLYVVADPAAGNNWKVSGTDGIVADEDGYLKVDCEGIIQEGGGLAVDEDGKLYVDFSTMPTDKFEALLKSIRVPIWLEEDTTFYVNGTTGNDSNNGLTESTAFKTIQACIDYVTANYNLSNYTATISIADGTYEEQYFQVGNFSTQTGVLVIKGASEDRSKVVVNVLGHNYSSSIYSYFNTGIVYLEFLTFNFTLSNFSDREKVDWIHVFQVEGSSTIELVDVEINFALDSDNLIATEIDVIACETSATFNLNCRTTINITRSANYSGIVRFFFIRGRFCINDASDAFVESDRYITLNGDVSETIYLESGMAVRNTTKAINFSNCNVTGVRYTVGAGGTIFTQGGGENFFPGSITGSVLYNGYYC